VAAAAEAGTAALRAHHAVERVEDELRRLQAAAPAELQRVNAAAAKEVRYSDAKVANRDVWGFRV
jgi:hypothetical protein